MKGYIALHRKIMENEFYLSEKFTKSQAWIDLLLLATHTDRTIFIRGIEINLKAGELCYSQLSLARRWKWDFKTVCKFLKLLENRKMVETKTNNVTTIISIVNWQEYQVLRNRTVYENLNHGDQNGEQKETKMESNNNVNNVNKPISTKKEKIKFVENNNHDLGISKEEFNEKENIFKIIPPKIEWIIDRCSKMNYKDSESESEKFFNHYESNGWKVGKNPMKNWSSALSNWFMRKKEFNKLKNINNERHKIIKESKSERINRNLEAAGTFLRNIESFN